MVDRYSLVPAVHAFVRDYERDEVLLIRRSNTGWLDGFWTVPSGHLEKGESVLTATARELLEEVNISTSESSLRVVGVMHRQGEDAGRVDYFVELEGEWQGEPENMEPHKASELRWAKTSDILGMELIPAVAVALLQPTYPRGGAWTMSLPDSNQPHVSTNVATHEQPFDDSINLLRRD